MADDGLQSRPIILGIVGDSAAGKTTITRGVSDILGPENVTVISVDDYHRFDRRERAENGLTALDPSANHMDILEQHLRLLGAGEPVLKPVYNHATGTIERPELVVPTKFVIAEGLLGYTTKAMRDCYDVKIFLDPQEELRVHWKIQRDVARRGYSRQDVLDQLSNRANDSAAHVMPQRAFADIVIRFGLGSGTTEYERALNVRHTLRPTLPHPNFSQLLDDETRQSVRHGLERDMDSKPVDVLHIDGEITDQRTRRVEKLLWQLLPERHHVHAGVGEYFDGAERQTSNPLALTQLLVAFHMVKAAEGVYAL